MTLKESGVAFSTTMLTKRYIKTFCPFNEVSGTIGSRDLRHFMYLYLDMTVPFECSQVQRKNTQLNQVIVVAQVVPEVQEDAAACSGWRRSRLCKSLRNTYEGWSTDWRRSDTPET